jgi:hypothetical protein
MGKPSVALVSAHYYPDYQRRNLREIERLKRAIPIDRHVGVLNGGAELIEVIAGPSGTQWVGHDNEGQEFGAYQRGLDVLLEGERPDWVIFMNDTLGTHTRLACGVLQRLQTAVESPTSSLPLMAGVLHHIERSCQIHGHRGSRHMRSRAMALNGVALGVLERRIRAAEIDALIAGAATRDSFFSEGCDPALQLRLASYLFQTDAALKWYRAAPLTHDNCAAMALKARAILQEFYLSLRLESASAIFIDLRASRLRDKIRDGLETEWFFKTTPGSIRQAG